MQAGEKGRRCLEQALLPHLDALLAAADEEEEGKPREKREQDDESKISREHVLECLQQHMHGGHTIEEAAALQGAAWLLPWLVAWRVRHPQHSSLLIETLCQVCAHSSGKWVTCLSSSLVGTMHACMHASP
jgi:hypothetical protein